MTEERNDNTEEEDKEDEEDILEKRLREQYQEIKNEGETEVVVYGGGPAKTATRFNNDNQIGSPYGARISTRDTYKETHPNHVVLGHTPTHGIEEVKESINNIDNKINIFKEETDKIDSNVAEIAEKHGELLRKHKEEISQLKSELGKMEEQRIEKEIKQRRHERFKNISYVLSSLVGITAAISVWRLASEAISPGVLIVGVTAILIVTAALAFTGLSNISKENKKSLL